MIKPNHDYHGVELTDQPPTEIIVWLCNTYGPPDGTRWYIRGLKVFFANKNDHLMFLLKVSR